MLKRVISKWLKAQPINFKIQNLPKIKSMKSWHVKHESSIDAGTIYSKISIRHSFMPQST